jgi:hypothetical protein
MKESVVDIKGHRYRYRYDPETKDTLYVGPVGDAPAISEGEFAESFNRMIEWQQGRIVIPKDDWVDFKKRIRNGWNKIQNRKRDTTNKLVEKGIEGGPPYRLTGYDLHYRWFDRDTEPVELNWAKNIQIKEGLYEDWSDIARLVGASEHQHTVNNSNLAMIRWDKKPKKATMKALDEQWPLANTRTNKFEFADAKIIFDNKTHSVIWDVDEMNHSVEVTNEHPMSDVFYDTLNMIKKWPKGTGGKIRYANEDGENYISMTYPKESRY